MLFSFKIKVQVNRDDQSTSVFCQFCQEQHQIRKSKDKKKIASLFMTTSCHKEETRLLKLLNTHWIVIFKSEKKIL